MVTLTCFMFVTFGRTIFRYKILNPETSSDWFIDPETNIDDSNSSIGSKNSISSLRSLGLSWLRKWYKAKKKREVNLLDLIVCPNCHGNLDNQENAVVCSKCMVSFSQTPILDFNNGQMVSAD